MGALVNNLFLESPQEFAEKFTRVELGGHGRPDEADSKLNDHHPDAMVIDDENEAHSESESADSDSTEDNIECEKPEDETTDKRIQQLTTIEKKLGTLSTKLNHSAVVREKILARLFCFVLLVKMGRKFDFDELSASKYRTSYGRIVEELMKILCKLDEIQSFGSSRVKIQRKRLVLQINKELLPKADDIFAKATKLVNFTETVLEAAKLNLKIQNQSKKNPAKDVSHGGEKLKTQANAKPHIAVEKSRQEVRKSTEEPIVSTAEDKKSYIVEIVLPRNERAQEVNFRLHSASEMTLLGRNFQLPIEVDPRKAILGESTYECKGSRSLLLRIPKRKRQVFTNRPPRYQDSFEHPFHRPMVWGI